MTKTENNDQEDLPVVGEILPTEVCIDGIVYDIANFAHPGGEQIHLFGGNDVTVHYRMIHPFHGAKKPLRKMKAVGRMMNYQEE